MAERQARNTAKMELFQRLLSLEESKNREDVDLPCNTLPVAENKRFFGRQGTLQELDGHLTLADTRSSLSSVALR